ncbi:hypothetical protein ZWY2020_000539 [Hordeum vulgare]|nr:hypothetical protein ZWY2020_000539 [Hordeum vulgare]
MAAMGGVSPTMEDVVEDKFPEGLRVLVVDDDCVCLKVLEALLRHCKYQPTTVMDAMTALRMLRAGKQQFDLVITDVRMPGMDGFKLLELIRLEMDLPVIMLSVDCEKKVVMKGIEHGACDFMVKPVRTHELKNIWQHVERRRNPEAISHISDYESDHQRVERWTAAKSTNSGNKINEGDHSSKNKESTCISTTQKKRRVEWTIELHNKFLEAINQIGLDRAVPKKILELMHVDYLTRESIASHLQKYRLHLKKVKSNPNGNAYERRNSLYNMNNQGNFMHNHENGRWRVSSGDISSWSTNNYGAMGHLAQPKNIKGNLCMGSFLQGGRIPRYVGPQPSDARRFTNSDEPSIRLHNNIPNEIMLDEFASCNSYADLMRGKLMEISKGKTPSTLRSSFAKTTCGGGRSLIPSQVNIPRINQLESSAISSGRLPPQNDMTPFISNMTSVGAFSDQMVAFNVPSNPSSTGMLNAHNSAPVAPSQMVNGGSITESEAYYIKQMSPFNMETNRSSVGMMLNGSYAPCASRTSMKETHMVNSGQTTLTLPKHQTNGFVSLTQLLDGGDGAGILPMQEGTLDQEPLNDQLNDISAFSMDDIFANIHMEDFTGDDAIMDAE